jgi:hypothetical protein
VEDHVGAFAGACGRSRVGEIAADQLDVAECMRFDSRPLEKSSSTRTRTRGEQPVREMSR